MVDAAFLLGFVALPIVALLLVRSITWLALALLFTLALVGTALQTLVRVGLHFDFRTSQVVLLI